MHILIKNGLIIKASGKLKGDVRIKDGLITETGPDLPPYDAHVIDATSMYVLPGGIDPHVHLHLEVNDIFSTDDFYTGSKAALFGGTTSIIDFVTPKRSQSLVEALQERLKDVTESFCDYSFHVSPVDLHDGIEKEINEIINFGINSFKVYLAYKDKIGIDDAVIRSLMQIIKKAGGLIAAHCEDGDAVTKLSDELFESGMTGPQYHPISRPVNLEAKAVKKMIRLSRETACPVYIVHVSAKESMQLISKAVREGELILAETCPQYLLLDESAYSDDSIVALSNICSPPYRKKADQESLWAALQNRDIKTIGTDHCPFTLNQKKIGISDFRKVPNGIGGIEHRMQLLFSDGVVKNKISLEQWVALTSTNPARIFGLKNKGEIKSGYDADIVVWDPDHKEIITSSSHHQNCDINVYEGKAVQGKALQVFQRGNWIIQNGKISQNNPTGKLIKRAKIDYSEWANRSV